MTELSKTISVSYTCMNDTLLALTTYIGIMEFDEQAES